MGFLHSSPLSSEQQVRTIEQDPQCVGQRSRQVWGSSITALIYMSKLEQDDAVCGQFSIVKPYMKGKYFKNLMFLQ